MLGAIAIIPEEKNDRWVLLLAFICLFVSSYFLFFHQSSIQIADGAIPIGTLRTDGTVRVRHAKNLYWGNVNSDSTVYLRDIIYTPKDTTAEFVWNDKRLVLEPESMVQFDEVSMDRMEIVLMEGKVKGDANVTKNIIIKKAEVFEIIPSPKRARSELADVETLELRQLELNKQWLKVLERKLDIEPMLSLQSPNIYLNRLTDYKIRLISPAAKEYNISQTRWVPMKWTAPPLSGVSYEIEVSRNSDFKRVISHPSNNVEVHIQFEGEGEWYWKVKAVKGKEFIYSEDSHLTLVEKGGIKLEAPRRLSEQAPKGAGAKPGSTALPFKMPVRPKVPGNLLLK